MLHQRWIATACRWIIAAGIGMVVLIALVTVGVRTYIACALNQSNIEHIAEGVLHLPTQINAVWSHWYGFQPRVHLRGVTLLNKNTHKPMVQLEQVVIQVNLLESALHRQLVPAAVLVRGVKLRLQSNESHRLMLMGHHANATSFDISHLIQWLLLQTNISVSDVSLDESDGSLLKHFHLQFQRSGSIYRFYLKGGVGLSKQATMLLQGRLYVPTNDWRHADGLIYAAVDRLSADDFQRLARLVPAWRHMSQHSLAGSMQAWLTIAHGQWQQLISRYAIQHAAFGSTRLTNLMGQFQLHHQSQSMTVNWQQSRGVLNQSAVFGSPVDLGHLSTQFMIPLQARFSRLVMQYLHWQTPDFTLRLEGRYSHSAKQSVANILGGFRVHQLAHLKSVLPLKTLNPKLKALLQHAFQSGRLVGGEFLYRGPLALQAISMHAAQFNLFAKLQGVTLKFLPTWPILFSPVARVAIHDKQVVVDSQHAVIMHNALSDIHVSIPDFMHPIMRVTLEAQSSLHNTMQLLWHSPLLVPLQLKPLNLTGQVGLHLHLLLPLYLQGLLKTDVCGVLSLHNVAISNNDWHLNVNDINGLIHFDNQTLSSKKLVAQFYGLPLKLTIHSVPSTSLPITRVHVNGVFDIKTLTSHLKNPLLKDWQGVTPFALRLDLHSLDDPRGDTFYFSSSLRGLRTQYLPPLFSKNAADKRPVKVVINVHHDKSVFVRGDYNHQINAALVLHHMLAGFQFYSVNVGLEDGKPFFQKSPGIAFNGHLKTIDMAAWLSLYHQIKMNQAGTSTGIQLRQADIKVDQVTWKNKALHQLHLTLKALQKSWRIDLDSQEVAGFLDVPVMNSSPWRVRLSRLILPHMGSSTGHFNLIPEQIPAMDMQIHHLSIGKHRDGDLSIMVAHKQASLVLKQLHWVTPTFDMSMQGVWQHHLGKDQTHLRGYLSSMHWGRCLNRWQSSPMLLAGQGKVVFSAWWPDTPTHIDWSHLLGRMTVHLENGTVGHLSKDAMKSVGLGRFLNVFSVGAMVSHMRSDFKDTPNNGLWFNHLDGHWSIRQGVAQTRDLQLAGQVVSVKGKGMVDLAHHQVDMQLALTPQVTNSLPLVAGILGGPIVGVATWVANKMFGQQVDQLSASMVHVSGAWSHPHINKIHQHGNQMV